jgi:acetylornithine/N-succinyldiaminopimelate aminotransferase
MKAENAHVWDRNGNRYIDFSSGWNVANLGWNHPEISRFAIKQFKRNVYSPIWTDDLIQETYAARLLQFMPKGMDVVCRATSGTEANEMAIKICRAVTGKKKIIGFKDTYHGQLFASMALGFDEFDTEAVGPLVPQFIQLQYPSTTDNLKEDILKLGIFTATLVEALSQKDVAAVVCEPEMVTGWGSCKVAVKGFTKAVRTITQQYGALLILDEVGTGFSRIGKLFGYEHAEITPDVITLAKGISNGAAPIGAVVTSSHLVEAVIPQVHLTSTFGWTPVACAAALKTLDLHVRDKTWIMSQKKGSYLKTTLKRELSNLGSIEDVRGIGLEIGIELLQNIAPDIVGRSFEKGLHLSQGGTNVIQIMPPLTISGKLLDRGIEILVQSIKAAQT